MSAILRVKQNDEWVDIPAIIGPQGAPGTPGQDGVSPTATVTQTTSGATITVTDAEGTTTAEITNGQDGAPGAPGSPGAPGTDGISPTISVTDITGGHRVTITDATGPHSFEVMDGDAADAPVQDVQVNGVSVLTDGVANVPLATTDSGKAGAVKVNAFNGLTVNTGVLTINSAYDTDIKAGTNMLKPIPPGRQQQSAFYGLAKAAGDTTQSESSNAVGTYTDEAKTAIRTMLGAETMEWKTLSYALDEASASISVDTGVSCREMVGILEVPALSAAPTNSRATMYIAPPNGGYAECVKILTSVLRTSFSNTIVFAQRISDEYALIKIGKSDESELFTSAMPNYLSVITYGAMFYKCYGSGDLFPIGTKLTLFYKPL